MTEKDLKKLSRKQLLELLLSQTERADSLEKEVEDLQKKLEDKIIAQSEAGSIAEASLELNGVFSAAQSAADQYLENVRILKEKAEIKLKELEDEKLLLKKEREYLERERFLLETQKTIPLIDETEPETVTKNGHKPDKSKTKSGVKFKSKGASKSKKKKK